MMALGGACSHVGAHACMRRGLCAGQIFEWVKAHGGEPIIPFSGIFENKLFDMPDDGKAAYCKEARPAPTLFSSAGSAALAAWSDGYAAVLLMTAHASAVRGARRSALRARCPRSSRLGSAPSRCPCTSKPGKA